MTQRHLVVRLTLVLFALTLVAGVAYTQCTPHKGAGPSAQASVNINSCTSAELANLPGISKSDADNIIAHRPYKSTDELVSRNVITQAQYNAIKNSITAGSAN